MPWVLDPVDAHSIERALQWIAGRRVGSN